MTRHVPPVGWNDEPVAAEPRLGVLAVSILSGLVVFGVGLATYLALRAEPPCRDAAWVAGEGYLTCPDDRQHIARADGPVVYCVCPTDGGAP